MVIQEAKHCSTIYWRGIVHCSYKSNNQALWLQKILHDLHIEEEEIIEIPVDNQVAITISHDLVVHGKTKHLNMKLYFLREV